MSVLIRLKRAYQPPGPDDGYRVLVDRVWPRGVDRESLKLDEWMRDIAPSADLRTWYGHHVENWPAFRSQYLGELLHGAARPALDALVDVSKHHRVLTLVFGARDVDHSQAVVLRDALEFARRLALPSPRKSMQRALDDVAAAERRDLEYVSGERLEGHGLVPDVAVVAFSAAYVDGRTSGLCHEGALELFGEALRDAARGLGDPPTSPPPRSGAEPATRR